MRRHVRLPAVLLAIALVLAACGGGDDTGDGSGQPGGGGDAKRAEGQGPEGSGPAPDTVTLGIRLDVDKFDPHTTLSDYGAQQMMPFLYDTLLRRDVDGKIVAAVAEAWDVDPTQTKGTFTIRSGMTCSDGTPLDAAAVAASFQRMADPKSGAFAAGRIFGPGGAKSITSDAGARTVTIELNAPNNEMVLALAMSGMIVCPAGLADLEALKTAPQGSGPYRLVEARRDDQYTLERRDDYAALPAGTKVSDLPKTVVLRVIKDDATTAALLEQGKLQVGSVLTQDAKRLQAGGKLVSVPAKVFGTDAIVFNHDPSAPTSDPALRRALARFVDSEQASAAQTQGLGTPRRTLYTPNIDCYDEDGADAAPKYDEAAGAAALDEAGYRKGPDGKRTKPGGAPLKLRVAGNNTQGQIVQYLADQLSKAGFDVDVWSGDYASSVQRLFGGEFDVASFPFISSTPSPVLWVSQIGTGGGANFFKISNPGFDAPAKAALAATAPDERCRLWGEAEKAVLEAVDVLPIGQPTNYWFGNGVTFNALYYKIDPFSLRKA